MAAYHPDGDLLVHVYVVRGELGSRRRGGRKAIHYFMLTTFGVLCEHEEDHFPITRWIFKKEMLPAIERMLEARKRPLVLLSSEEIALRSQQLRDGDRTSLDDQPLGGEEKASA